MKTIVFLVLACIVIFCFAGCNAKDSPEHTGMPDPEVVRRQKTVEKVNIVYGADKASVTLHKPSNAYFEISPEKAQSAGEKDTYEAWFVGFEIDDVKNVTHSGKGLLGFKIYSIGKEFSPSYLKMLFNELFYIER